MSQELLAAITRAVREEVGRSALGSPSPVGGQASRQPGRRGSRSTSRRRLEYDSQSSGGEYSGGDSPYPRESCVGRDGPHTRDTVPSPWAPSRVRVDGQQVVPPSPAAEAPERKIPTKISVNNPFYIVVFDCETYALANKSTRYTRSQAHTLGRLKKDVGQSFGYRSEWNGTPPLKVFQFLKKFSKACDDNDVSEAEAFYMLQDFTKEPLRSEVMAVMPSRNGGNPGEVSSYLELINWMLRLHADETSLALQVEEFNRATQVESEDERAFAERLRQLNVLCGFIHSQGVLKGRYVEGVHRAARATVRERNTPGMSLAELSRIAQTKGDEYRWLVKEQRKEREAEADKAAEATRLRRLTRLAQPPRATRVGSSTVYKEPVIEAVAATTPPTRKGPGTASDRPCWQCGEVGHWAEACPKLDPRLRARLTQGASASTSRSVRGNYPRRPTTVSAVTDTVAEEDSPLEEGEVTSSGTDNDGPTQSAEGNEQPPGASASPTPRGL